MHVEWGREVGEAGDIWSIKRGGGLQYYHAKSKQARQLRNSKEWVKLMNE